MASSRTQIINELVILTQASKHTVDRIGVNLAKSGHITKSAGRGLHAKEVTPGDVSKILIALMAANTTSEASEVVSRYSELSCGQDKFGDVLENIISNYNIAKNVKAVSAVRNYAQTTVVWNDGSVDIFESEETEKSGMRVEVTLMGNEVISFLAWRLNQAKESSAKS